MSVASTLLCDTIPGLALKAEENIWRLDIQITTPASTRRALFLSVLFGEDFSWPSSMWMERPGVS